MLINNIHSFENIASERTHPGFELGVQGQLGPYMVSKNKTLSSHQAHSSRDSCKAGLKGKGHARYVAPAGRPGSLCGGGPSV